MGLHASLAACWRTIVIVIKVQITPSRPSISFIYIKALEMIVIVIYQPAVITHMCKQPVQHLNNCSALTLTQSLRKVEGQGGCCRNLPALFGLRKHCREEEELPSRRIAICKWTTQVHCLLTPRSTDWDIVRCGGGQVVLCQS